jgi:hypothetical protein
VFSLLSNKAQHRIDERDRFLGSRGIEGSPEGCKRLSKENTLSQSELSDIAELTQIDLQPPDKEHQIVWGYLRARVKLHKKRFAVCGQKNCFFTLTLN